MASVLQLFIGKTKTPTNSAPPLDNGNISADQLDQDFVLLAHSDDDTGEEKRDVLSGNNPPQNSPGHYAFAYKKSQQDSCDDHSFSISGIPFKLDPAVLENGCNSWELSTLIEGINIQISQFNWNDFEYSFKLETNTLREFGSSSVNVPDFL